MPTQKQLEANRRNARFSTGPKTPTGKAAVSRNASKHGLASSRALILREENKKEFQQLLDNFRSEYQPQGALQDFLVFQLAAAEWRLRRIARFESGFITDRLDDLRAELEIDPPQPDIHATFAEERFNENTRLLGGVFHRNCSGDPFIKLLRYENTTRRAFYRALHELKRVQSRPAEPPPPQD